MRPEATRAHKGPENSSYRASKKTGVRGYVSALVTGSDDQFAYGLPSAYPASLRSEQAVPRLVPAPARPIRRHEERSDGGREDANESNSDNHQSDSNQPPL